MEILLEHDSVGYGFETEILSRAEAYGFRTTEVGVKIKYGGLVKTSKRNPILHGADIISTIMKIAIEKRPLLFFGVAGLVSLVIAMTTAVVIIMIFNDTRYL